MGLTKRAHGNSDILYAKVKIKNKEWLEKEAVTNGVSLGIMLDLILGRAKDLAPIRIADLAGKK